MNNIYLAGPFSWQERIRNHAEELKSLGYTITSRWLTQESTFTTSDNSTIKSQKTWDNCQTYSVRDIEDIFSADTLILFEPGVAMERVTRIAEFGGALFTGRKCIVIGPENEETKDVISNIFVKLSKIPEKWLRHSELGFIQSVSLFRTWKEFLDQINIS